MVLGQALHQVDELLPSSSLPFDDIAAAVLLVFFGVRTLQVSFSITAKADALLGDLTLNLASSVHSITW